MAGIQQTHHKAYEIQQQISWYTSIKIRYYGDVVPGYRNAGLRARRIVEAGTETTKQRRLA